MIVRQEVMLLHMIRRINLAKISIFLYRTKYLTLQHLANNHVVACYILEQRESILKRLDQ